VKQSPKHTDTQSVDGSVEQVCLSYGFLEWQHLQSADIYTCTDSGLGNSHWWV